MIRRNTTNWLLSLSRSGNSCSDFSTLSLFLPEVPLQLVNRRCSSLTQEDHFCPDPTADLKDLREAFSDTEEPTQTFLRQGLLPSGVWSSRLHKLIDYFGRVWETGNALPVAFRITSNNAPKF